MYLNNLIYHGMAAIPFYFSGGMSVSAFSFLRSGLTFYQEIISPKNGTHVHPK